MTLATLRGDKVVSAGVARTPEAGAASFPAPDFFYTARCATLSEMPVIKVNDQQFSLRPGPNRLGAGEGVDVTVAENSRLGVQAIVDVASDSRAVIRRAGAAATVRVNGVPLVDPTPLMHGDRLEIGGREVFYTDDGKTGSTQFVSSGSVADAVAKRAGPARATTATGGRLVSLFDGKEYMIPAHGITIGRDAASGVVVAENEVSRKHADIRPTETGYEIRDFSANGVYINGTRLDTSAVLSRSDVIRIGTQEFRFSADAPAVAKSSVAPQPVAPQQPPAAPIPAAPIPAAPIPAAPAAVAQKAASPAAGLPAAGSPAAGSPAVRSAAAPPAPAPRQPAPAPPAAAPAMSSPTPPLSSIVVGPGTPAPAFANPSGGVRSSFPSVAVGSGDRPVLGTLEIMNEGPTRGMRFDICVPLAHIGRGAHNDIVVKDESVSDTHAKLQRRDDGWYVCDVGSTNGTYVGGQRIVNERRLDGAPDLRFGGVKMMFRPREVGTEAHKGTRVVVGFDRSKQRPATPSASASAAPQQTAVPRWSAPRAGLPLWVWALVGVALVAAVGFFLIHR
jgi:pSer/pThr/pTyr-binding forkhead associated (FHA) protein